MHMQKMLQKIAYLEFVNDQLSTELNYVDRLLRAVGFTVGLTTVKQAAQELASQDVAEQDEKASIYEESPPEELSA